MSRYNRVSTFFLISLVVSLGVDGIVTIPVWWYFALIVLFFLMNVYGALSLRASYFVEVLSEGSDGVSLTFNNGLTPGNTERILDILSSCNVHATFFCDGASAVKHTDLLNRIHREGHLIGNFTFEKSRWFFLKSSPMMVKELAETERIIFTTTGKRTRMFRPPYGTSSPMLASAIRRMNYVVVGWSHRMLDLDAVKMNGDLLRISKSGAIYAMDASQESVVSALPQLLEILKSGGITPVTVDQLVRKKAYL